MNRSIAVDLVCNLVLISLKEASDRWCFDGCIAVRRREESGCILTRRKVTSMGENSGVDSVHIGK